LNQSTISITAYQEKLNDEKRAEYATQVVYPCVLNTIQIINKRRPMIIGVDVAEGTLKIGTPICAVRLDPETKQKNVFVLVTYYISTMYKFLE